jgi:polysaccharide export outer membrane protein
LFSSQGADQVSPGSRTATIPDQVVARDGSISVPYAGRIRAAGRSSQQVEQLIIERLQGKAIEPQVLVNLSRNVTNTVTVTGEVANGARVPLTLRGDRVMDVIAAAGGYRSPSHETFVSLTRGNKTAKAPIQLLIDTPSENVFVHPGDVLTVERTPQTFTAVGATGANTVVPIGVSKQSRDEAIGRAGGAQDARADPDGIFVLRYEPAFLVKSFPTADAELLKKDSVPVAYHLSLRDPEAYFLARRFEMRDKDILLVTNSPLTELSKLSQLFGIVTQPAMTGASGAIMMR